MLRIVFTQNLNTIFISIIFFPFYNAVFIFQYFMRVITYHKHVYSLSIYFVEYVIGFFVNSVFNSVVKPKPIKIILFSSINQI